MGCNKTIINVATCKMGRTITYNKHAAPTLYASHGIVAGDSVSDSIVKMYYIRAFDAF